MPLQEQARVAAPDGTVDPHPRDEASRLADAVDRAVVRTTAAVGAAWERLADSPAATDPEPRRLIAILAGQEGGKQLRARLAIAAYLGMGGDDPAVCDALGAAVQLLHTGLCVHDDLIDGDDRRHGRPNVAGTVRSAWSAAGAGPDVATRQADAAALLAGDLAISASLRAVAETPVGPALRVELMREVLEALDAAIAGELLDVRSEQLPPETARPIRMAELKTAGYSVILPLRLGAVASGSADASTLAALGEYGRHLGIAYQLKDDELAVFGDAGRTGKSTSSDIRGGKRTRLLQFALDAADPTDRAVLDAAIGHAELTEEGVEGVRAVMRRSAALERHRALIVGHAADAVAALEAAALPGRLEEYLQVIARGVPGRDR